MSHSQDQLLKSPGWKLPEDVMRLHRLKLKKRALQARLRGKNTFGTLMQESGASSKDNMCEADNTGGKRKNPFRCENVPAKKARDDGIAVFPADFDTSCDNSLFQLLTAQSSSSSASVETSFSSILSRLQTTAIQDEIPELNAAGKKYIPVDWALKTKVRFMSEKPFPWTQKLRTCEEASGTTGFVRCTSVGPSEVNDSHRRLDTSASARFHQCCLVWTHPYLPWLQLFPRSSGRVGDTADSAFASDMKLRDCLHREWGESLRSLFQLVRACQCPYFYVCAANFTCLFRAAGIGGFSNTHAFVTPTTRGLRQLLKEEDVVFTMPLKRGNPNKRSSSEGPSSDMGYETQDSAGEDIQSEHTKRTEEQDEDDLDGDYDDDDGEDWLHSMGMGKEEIRKLNSKQAKTVHNKEREVDRTPESLIYVEGVEAQAFFNFLMNCKSTVAASGPLAGVPPTLLAPVAFRGGTLQPIKVRQSVVKLEGCTYHSVELKGPVLPHVLHDLCSLLHHTQEEFSATFAQVEQTGAFTLAAKTERPSEDDNTNKDTTMESAVSPAKTATVSCPVTPTKAPSAFGQENLSDCGLQPSVLQSFCCADLDRVQVLDGLKYCSDGTYTWS